MSKRIGLVVIDGQNDFLASGNEPSEWPTPFGGRRMGSLFVSGADQEALLVRDLIVKHGKKFCKLVASLDSHHKRDGSHNTSYKMANGASPPPFTVVTNADAVAQKYVPRFPVAAWEGKIIPSIEWLRNYTAALEKDGRAPLTLWPVHCEIGTWGQDVYWPLQEAYNHWVEETDSYIDYVTKGQWPFTEHYSAMRADVQDSTRPETLMNTGLVQDLDTLDMIVWVGWAGSHCLAWTAKDAVNFFGTGDNPFVKKSVFLEDACAPVGDIPGVPSFAKVRQDFLDEMQNRGGTVTTTKKLFA